MTKMTVGERQQKIKLLATKEKDKTITREEKADLSELREAERRRKKNIIMKKERKALANGKKEALQKILDSVGIATENQMKNILRFVIEAKPELIPKMPLPEPVSEPVAEELMLEPEQKAEPVVDEPTPDLEFEPEPAAEEPMLEPEPTCEVCGAVLVEKMSRRGKRFLGCPNWTQGEKHTTRDVDAPDRVNRSA